MRDISQEDHLEWCSYDLRQPEAGSQLTCFVDLDHGFLKKEILHQEEPQVIWRKATCSLCWVEFIPSGVFNPWGFHRERACRDLVFSEREQRTGFKTSSQYHQSSIWSSSASQTSLHHFYPPLCQPVPCQWIIYFDVKSAPHSQHNYHNHDVKLMLSVKYWC